MWLWRLWATDERVLPLIKRLHRKVLLVSLLFCGIVVGMVHLAEPRSDNYFTVLKASKTIRSAGQNLTTIKRPSFGSVEQTI